MPSSVQAGTATNTTYGGYAGPAYGGGLISPASNPAAAAAAASSSPTVTATTE